MLAILLLPSLVSLTHIPILAYALIKCSLQLWTLDRPFCDLKIDYLEAFSRIQDVKESKHDEK